jgi:hypothetical protein
MQPGLSPHDAARGAVPPPPPPRTMPVASDRKGGGWWIAPAIVIALVLVGWLVAANMPFGGDEASRPAKPVPTETIAEGGPAAGETGTVIEGPGQSDDSFEITTTTAAPPPNAPVTATSPSAAVPTATAAVQTPPVVVQPSPRAPTPTPTPAPTRTPAPTQTQPQNVPVPARVVPPRPERAGEISATQAEVTLRGYVVGKRYYGVASECVRVSNRGYRNVGYNLEVWHSCPGSGGGARLLGRWRVDAKTGELFRQRDDGRYRRP